MLDEFKSFLTSHQRQLCVSRQSRQNSSKYLLLWKKGVGYGARQDIWRCLGCHQRGPLSLQG